MKLEQYNTYKITATFKDENDQVVSASNVKIYILKYDGTPVVDGAAMSTVQDHYVYFLDTSILPELGKYYVRVEGTISNRRVSNTETFVLVRCIEEVTS